MTLYDVPSEERALFSAVVCEIVKHILGGQKEAWKAFFLLPRLVLALPRGGRGVAKLVHTYLLLFRAGEWSALLKRPFRSMGESRGEFNKEKRAISLARVGYFSGATRALADCSPADTADPKVYKNLIDLHPAASRLSGELQLNPANVISEDIFLKVLSTTPPRRAPDAAGWRGDYFKSFSPEARIMVFKLVEHILQNPKSLPADLRPFFFGARLTALHKPNGGIRPIAVGVILRKLVSTTLVNTISAQLPDTFYPHQHGTGTPGGAENVVQGLRLAQALDRENVVVGIDFSNAFNTMDRQAICDQVVDKFPQLRTWFELSYGKPSRLLVKGQRPISSAKGVQQGDPLGPFFFALALQPVLQKAAANGSCVLAYLDDVHICGKPSVVAPAVKVLLEEAAKIGLQCNLNKCWATKAVDVDNNRLPIVTKPVVLGAPLDVDQKLQTDIIPEQLMKSVAGLPDLQIALHLMRYLHNSRFIYQFRLSSVAASQELAQAMMHVTRKSLASMLKCEELPEHAWRQALLPPGPGLGLTNLSEMAPVMAYASVLEASVRLAKCDRKLFGRFASPSGWDEIKNAPIYDLYQQALQMGNSIEGFSVQPAKLQSKFAVGMISPKALADFLNDPTTPNTSKAIVKSTVDSPIAPQLFSAIPSC